MVSGGSRSEASAGNALWCLKQWFGGMWKGLFFLAGCGVLAGGVLGILGGIQAFLSPFSMCNQIFLCLFGLIMLVIDCPFDFRGLQELKFSVWRYCLFMTRFTGRGIWYLYLATLIWSSLYNLDLEPFLGFLLAGFIGALGGMSIFYGLQKSFKLENCRQSLVNIGVEEWMRLCPQRGLSLAEFNDITRRVAQTDFSSEELQYISSALSHSIRSDEIISRDEFRSWVTGSMTVM